MVRGCIPYGQCILSPPECYTDFDVGVYSPVSGNRFYPQTSNRHSYQYFVDFESVHSRVGLTVGLLPCMHVPHMDCIVHVLISSGVSSIKVLISRPRLLSDHLPDRYFVINDNYFILFLTRKIRSSIRSFTLCNFVYIIYHK